MKQFWQFILIVFLLSIPLWILGYIFDATKIIPIKLPISAIQFVCVLIAAILVTKLNRNSASSILSRGFDFKRVKATFWRYGIFVLMPLTVLLSYFLMKWNGIYIIDRQTPYLTIPLFLVVYGVSGYCEQIGWTAVATDELLKRFNIVTSGFLVGSIWALWHIIPFIQTHNSVTWIFWQCSYTIVYRILLTKIYTLTNRSVFATVALHMTYNTAFSMMPFYGSSYNPFYMTIATIAVSIITFILHRNNQNTIKFKFNERTEY